MLWGAGDEAGEVQHLWTLSSELWLYLGSSRGCISEAQRQEPGARSQGGSPGVKSLEAQPTLIPEATHLSAAQPQRPPLSQAEPAALRPLCLPVFSPPPPPPLQRFRLPTSSQKFLRQYCRFQGTFQEILFLESPLTFGLGWAPRLPCFVLGCFYCYSLKNLEPGCPGALAPLGLGGFPCGQGNGLEVVGGERGLAEKDLPSPRQRKQAGPCQGGKHGARPRAFLRLQLIVFLQRTQGKTPYSARLTLLFVKMLKY